MYPRFSFLSNLTYDQHLLAAKVVGATQNIPTGPAKDIVQATLYGNLAGAQATIRSGQEITSAVQGSTQALSGQMHRVFLANIFGSLLVSGTIAASTAMMVRRMDKIAVGVERLGVQFSEGMSLLSSQLDIQTNVLTEIRDQLARIHETLKSPLITQATEFRNIGLERLESGLWPEAVNAFEKAVALDESDPVSNMMLGELYLDAVDDAVNFHDPDKAEKYFSLAVRYSSAMLTKAPRIAHVRNQALYFRATAMLAKASVLKNKAASTSDVRAKLEEALALVEQLLAIDNDYHAALYLRSKLLLLLDHADEARQSFINLVDQDFQYLATAQQDDDFALHSDIGKQIIASTEPWYRKQLTQNANRFYDQLDAARSWEVSLPAEIGAWLKSERMETREEGISALSHQSFSRLAAPSSFMLSILHTAAQSIQELALMAISAELQRLPKAHKALQDSIRKRAPFWDSVDPDWFYPQGTVTPDLVEVKKEIDALLNESSAVTSEIVLSHSVSVPQAKQTYYAYLIVLDRIGHEVNAVRERASRIDDIVRQAREERKGDMITHGVTYFIGVLMIVIALLIIGNAGPMTLGLISGVVGVCTGVIPTFQRRKERRDLESTLMAQGASPRFCKRLTDEALSA